MIFSSNDKTFMKKTLEIASQGIPDVYPNPAVGCVITKQGEIISTGFHKKYGDPHAEVNAIKKLNKSISGLTMYVSLEPCNHIGKTDPCLSLIDQKIFERVVIAETDPNQTATGGAAELKNRGISVDIGLLREEARNLNRRFYTFHEKKRPYIILKYASTLDGFIAQENKISKWITNNKSRSLNHITRASSDAILIGGSTAIHDNPNLGSHGEGKDPKIIVIDPENKLNEAIDILHKDPIVYSKSELTSNRSDNVSFILNDLFRRNIQSILVEGGAQTITSFLDSGLFDELHCYIAPKFLGAGLNIYQGGRSIENNFDLELVSMKSIDNDLSVIYRRKH